MRRTPVCVRASRLSPDVAFGRSSDPSIEMWTDVETSEDLIGFRVHADLIRGVVTDATLLPATIGVFGDWGGGKTSIMKMLERDLDPDTTTDVEDKTRYESIACLYINGWLFEGYDDAKSALLSAVLMTLGEHKRFGPRVREKAASLLKSVNWMRVARLGIKEVAIPAIAAYASGGASLVPTGLGILGRVTGGLLGKSEATGSNTGAEATSPDAEHDEENTDPDDADDDTDEAKSIDWEKLVRKDKRAASPLDVRTFRDRFEKLLNDTGIKTLVVLIDDLDRCSPERIVDNLEAIKLFLNVPHTAFVIGADPRIVRHAIAYRYRTAAVEQDPPTPSAVLDGGQGETTDAEERLITDYLEKLIQIPYWLPRLSPAEIETYMALLFCRRDLTAERWLTCLTAAETQRNQNRYGTFGYAAVKAALGASEVEPMSLQAGLLFSAKVAPLITEGLKGNPRQVKRFLNAFSLRRKLAAVAKLTNVRDEVMVKLMILEYARPKEFRQLFEWQAAQGGVSAELRAMEAAYAAAAGRVSDEVRGDQEVPDRSADPVPSSAPSASTPRGGGDAVARQASRPTAAAKGTKPDSRRTRRAAEPDDTERASAHRIGTLPETPAQRAVGAPPWTSDFLKRWVVMEPLLSEVDLRDYFWVARDRLATTFSGLSLVPPIVRRTVEDLTSGNAGRRAPALVAAASMEDTERAALLELLSTQITRHPDAKVGYDAFRALVEHGVMGAASAFGTAARSVPAGRVPPAVGLDLRTLLTAHPGAVPELQPLLDHWGDSIDTPIGRALSSGRTRAAQPAAGTRPPRA